MPKGKKLNINPAMQFLSAQEPEQEADNAPEPVAAPPAIPTGKGAGTAPPEGFKVNPLYIEKKTKRCQLVMQPSLYAKIKAAADVAGLSFNEYVCQALERAATEEE